MLDFSKTTITRQRPFLTYAKVKITISRIIRNRAAFANKKASGCYLNLGCGSEIASDFCNLDYNWQPGVDICWDVTRGLPFPNEYVGGIFAEHILEHIALPDSLELLAECRRILRVGGTLRIIVPDGELYLSEYAKHRSGRTASMPYAANDKASFPFVTPIISVNRIFRGHGHQFIWDYETLRLALLGAGFAYVKKSSFGEGVDPKLLRDSSHRAVESLYVEAA